MNGSRTLGLALAALLGTGAAVAQTSGTNKDNGEAQNPHSVDNKDRPADNTPRAVTDAAAQAAEKDNPHSADANKTSGKDAGPSNNMAVRSGEIDNPHSTDAKDRASPTAVLERLHVVNVNEIAAGKLAQSNGSPRIAKFGEMMVRDHTAADEKVTTLAGKLSAKLGDEPKDSMARREMSDGEKMGSDLSKLHGEEFDRSFTRGMVDGHRKAIALIQTARTGCTEKQLCSLLDELRPTIEAHERAAKQLQGPQAMGRTK